MARFLPVMLDLRDRPCTVIGGGEIAEGKIRQLLEADARIHVIAPEVTEAVAVWAEAGRLSLERRAYVHGDLAGAVVVIASTDDRAVNAAIWQEGRSRGQLVNVVDDPPHCNFIAPAVVRRGALVVAISTAGNSPSSAGLIRRTFEQRFGAEWATLVDWLARTGNAAAGEDRLDALLKSNIAERLRLGDTAGARQQFDAIFAAEVGV